jgi:hypothetical protein
VKTLRGTRQLTRAEGRSIACTLRKFYPVLFESVPGLKDALPISILDGYRHRINREKKQEVMTAINKRKEVSDGEKEIKEKHKRLKNMYLVNKVKYFSKATDAELLQQLDVNTLDQDTHRILQHRIR